jgi:hypothetical protein
MLISSISFFAANCKEKNKAVTRDLARRGYLCYNDNVS